MANVQDASDDSDSEELPVARRRREASTDEEDGELEERNRSVWSDRRVGFGCDVESDGLGGAPGSDDEESYIEELEQVGEEVEKSEVVERSEGGVEEEVAEVAIAKEESENQPFVVPRVGAFYMHDDRSGVRGVRRRGSFAGRNLWESKHEQKWGHDKFEAMRLREACNKDSKGRRASDGHYEDLHKGRGRWSVKAANRSKPDDNLSNQNHLPKNVRGRGPVRYKPLTTSNSVIPETKNQQFGKRHGMIPNNDSDVSHLYSDSLEPRRHVSLSNMSSDVSLVCPVCSSNRDIPVIQRRDMHNGKANRYFPTSVFPGNKFSAPHSNAFLQGKTSAELIGQDGLYNEESIHPVTESGLTNLPSLSSMVWPTDMALSPMSRVQRRGLSFSAQPNHQSTPLSSLVNRDCSLAQEPVAQQQPFQSTIQPLHGYTLQLSPHPGIGYQVLPKAFSPNSYDPAEFEYLVGLSESGAALVGEGRDVAKGSERASLSHSGTRGDRNIPPTHFPAMQFGGQYHDRLGAPAAGVDLTGYVARSGVDLGNSEMSRLSVLAGPMGAVAAAHCSPYVTLDGGGYCAHSSGQTPSVNVSSDNSRTNKPKNDSMPEDTAEPVNSKSGQRGIKPHRYSKMNIMNFNQRSE